jgi:hypothetical protein
VKRLVLVSTTAMALIVPAVASAYPGYSATAQQRGAIEQSAKKTEPCGYSGQYRQLSDFRVVPLQSGKVNFTFASATWTPKGEDGQACDLVFVSEPGYTLKSLTTTTHPYVSWAPLSWGSSPLDDPTYLTKTFNEWFPTADAPNWSQLARSL